METDYRMQHRPGGPSDAEEQTAAPAHALDRVYPADVYDKPHFYGSGTGLHGGERAFRETVHTLRSIRGKPDAPVTMYRSLPPEHAHEGIHPGDWVSLHHSYAQGHGLHPTDPSKDWPVIKATVPAKHLWNNGDSLDEFGYHGPNVASEISKDASLTREAAIHPYLQKDWCHGGHFELQHSLYDDKAHLHVGTRAAAYDRLGPENDYNLRHFGTHHTACGRVLTNRFLAGLDDPGLDKPHAPIEPVNHVVEGARAYANLKGLQDPHAGIDYHKIMTHKGLLGDLGREYDKLPLDDPGAHKHFSAMRDEVSDQYHHMTHNMGINVHVTDHDPYKDVHELAHDVRNNHRIQVLGTHMTGGHPFFSNQENDRFRAVHDVFGHLGAGRDFDAHGEEAAFQAHARMFSHHALPAMTSETRGQNGSLITNGRFGPQRIAVLPHRLWHPGLAREAAIHPYLQKDWYHGGHFELQHSLYDDKAHLHVGTQKAALDRISPNESDDSYLNPPASKRHDRIHQVRIAPGATVCPHMHSDKGINGGHYDGAACGGDFDVHAYENDHEDPGSTSLIVNPKKVRVVEDLGPHPAWRQDRNERAASLVDDFRWEQDAQNRRAEQYGHGHKTETDSYYGKDGEGDAQEKRLTYKDWLIRHKAPEVGEDEKEYWNGHFLGTQHGDNPEHANFRDLTVQHAESPHPEHFYRGYRDGFMSDRADMEKIAILEGVKDSWLLDDMPAGMRVVAHVSGNQIDILHCPFCGSGAVIGRSDGTVECGYCTSVFTVQVQPTYNGFPQSVDGQPYQWPGMPDPAGSGLAAPDAPPGTDMGAPMQDPAMAGPPFNGAPGVGDSSDPADGEDDDEDSDDDDKPAFLKGKGDDKKSDDKKDKSKDKKKGDNPFAKKKSYITFNGAELDAEAFIAHLAIYTSKEPLKVAQVIRDEWWGNSEDL